MEQSPARRSPARTAQADAGFQLGLAPPGRPRHDAAPAAPLVARHRRRWLVALTLCLGLLLPASLPRVAWAQTWQRVGEEHGVALWVKPDPSRPVPVFKGSTVIDAPLYQVLAILSDIERAAEWNSRAAEVRMMWRRSDFRFRFYTRISAPWPFEDRDAVLDTSLQRSADGERIVATFQAVVDPTLPERANTVRFVHLLGIYRMERLPDERTLVEYEVDADPGGNMPDWLVRYATRAMPLDALGGLRKHVVRTRGQYAEFIQRHDPKARLSAVEAAPEL